MILGGRLNIHLADVHDVDIVARMHPAHVGAHVRRMLRPEGAVRTVEVGRLPALELGMVMKIVLPVEHAFTVPAGESHPVLGTSSPRRWQQTVRPLRLQMTRYALPL